MKLSLDANISVTWLPFIQLIWFLCTFFLIGGFIAGVPFMYKELASVCITNCMPYNMTPSESSILAEWGISIDLYAAYLIGSEICLAIIFVVPALIIFWRKSADWIGILTSLALIFIGLVIMAEETRALTRAFPTLYSLNELLISVGVILWILLFYLFPNGRFAPQWLAYFVFIASTIILLAPFLLSNSLRSTSGNLVVAIVGMSNVVIGFVSQLYRYQRVSTPLQQQQTKWVLIGFTSFFAATMYWTILAEFSTLSAGRPKLLFALTALPQAIALGLFPISVVIAMIRYRLWDVDFIIRRTLGYTVLTGSLLLVYFGGVVLIQTLVTTLTGQADTSKVTIVLSTLLIAALFNPLRHRLQSLIDRRFYRQKYNAEQILANFAQTTRDEVELDNLTAELVHIVQETMQPETIFITLINTNKAYK